MYNYEKEHRLRNLLSPLMRLNVFGNFFLLDPLHSQVNFGVKKVHVFYHLQLGGCDDTVKCSPEKSLLTVNSNYCRVVVACIYSNRLHRFSLASEMRKQGLLMYYCHMLL